MISTMVMMKYRNKILHYSLLLIFSKNMPKLKYGDKTAQILDNYVDNYKMPKGKTRIL